eukprot:ANDGO_05944.mRNA.1 Ribosome production factor 2 homolog
MKVKDIVRTPKTRSSKRALQKRLPKVFENPKQSLVLSGKRTSGVVSEVLKVLHSLRKPNSKKFTRKNDVTPFEDASKIEFLGGKNDTSLFVIGSHSKKRPHHLTFGRLFDFELYDMYEFEVEGFEVPPVSTQQLGSKPVLIFQGDQFENDATYCAIREYFLDFARGADLEKVSAEGLQHALVFSVIGSRIHIKQYYLQSQFKSEEAPKITAVPSGLHIVLAPKRNVLATADKRKVAMRRSKQSLPMKTKNVEEGAVGTVLGRVHMEKQDLQRLALKKMKGLKRARESPGAGAGAGAEAEVEAEAQTVFNERPAKVMKKQS